MRPRICYVCSACIFNQQLSIADSVINRWLDTIVTSASCGIMILERPSITVMTVVSVDRVNKRISFIAKSAIYAWLSL